MAIEVRDGGIAWVDGFVQLGPGSGFTVRTVVVVLPEGGVWVWSPTDLSDDDAAAIEVLGPVRYLVAPSSLHHLFLEAAAARWPEAEVWAPASAQAKQPHLTYAGTLGVDPEPWGGAVRRQHLGGNAWMDEHLFFHPASGTLLTADLVFRELEPRGWGTHLVTWLAGTRGRYAVSRLLKARTDDRAAMNASLQAVWAWGFTRVAMSHGAVLEADDAVAQTRAMFDWLGD